MAPIKYKDELRNRATLISIIKDYEKQFSTVNLVYAAKDGDHNNAMVLKGMLEGHKTIKTSVNRIHGG